MSRKFQSRDNPIDDDKEDLSNNDQLVSTIEHAILQERTRLAAALARNRYENINNNKYILSNLFY